MAMGLKWEKEKHRHSQRHISYHQYQSQTDEQRTHEINIDLEAKPAIMLLQTERTHASGTEKIDLGIIQADFQNITIHADSIELHGTK